MVLSANASVPTTFLFKTRVRRQTNGVVCKAVSTAWLTLFAHPTAIGILDQNAAQTPQRQLPSQRQRRRVRQRIPQSSATNSRMDGQPVEMIGRMTTFILTGKTSSARTMAFSEISTSRLMTIRSSTIMNAALVSPTLAQSRLQKPPAGTMKAKNTFTWTDTMSSALLKVFSRDFNFIVMMTKLRRRFGTSILALQLTADFLVALRRRQRVALTVAEVINT